MIADPDHLGTTCKRCWHESRCENLSMTNAGLAAANSVLIRKLAAFDRLRTVRMHCVTQRQKVLVGGALTTAALDSQLAMLADEIRRDPDRTTVDALARAAHGLRQEESLARKTAEELTMSNSQQTKSLQQRIKDEQKHVELKQKSREKSLSSKIAEDLRVSKAAAQKALEKATREKQQRMELKQKGQQTRTASQPAVEYQFSTPDDGVKKSIRVQGTGLVPPNGARVAVNYVGKLSQTQEKFDSSTNRDKPFRFFLGAGQVISCWDTAVAEMKVGESATVSCASTYAYGTEGRPPKIPPNADLTFMIEVLGFTLPNGEQHGIGGVAEAESLNTDVVVVSLGLVFLLCIVLTKLCYESKANARTHPHC
eukprot:TRINITY_DN3196_c0_g2_i1.p1 TRINITY_DN3196_c0_g2~~TRINITY_DN3196_c0_g2_i1.p1  ORF type:complete len:368 (+),score=38.82 TRINITY_DN3196_c0_g2_i1:128-1231(+)